MKRFPTGALMAVVSALFLVAGFTFAGTGTVVGAVSGHSLAGVHPDKKGKTCDKADGYCLEEINESDSDSGGIYTSGYYGLVAGGEYPFYSEGSAGDVYTNYEGYVYAYGYEELLRVRGGGQVQGSVALAPRTTIEDSGTARMSGGVGVVRLSPDFANTLDLRQGYQVFLTPDGDNRGLYVSQKYEGGFIVRESEHGRSTLEFDYRVLGHPVGASQQRLPAAQAPPRPPLNN
jgi:hypothetical protein